MPNQCQINARVSGRSRGHGVRLGGGRGLRPQATQPHSRRPLPGRRRAGRHPGAPSTPTRSRLTPGSTPRPPPAAGHRGATHAPVGDRCRAKALAAGARPTPCAPPERTAPCSAPAWRTGSPWSSERSLTAAGRSTLEQQHDVTAAAVDFVFIDHDEDACGGRSSTTRPSSTRTSSRTSSWSPSTFAHPSDGWRRGRC